MVIEPTREPRLLRPAALLLALTAATLPACRSLERHPLLGLRSVPSTLPGFSGVRAIQGYPSPAFQHGFLDGVRRRMERWSEQPDVEPTYEILVLGAGGPNGAFGAGLLTGWTESGDRPDFDLVTGVSAGALLAPFAFAGSDWDVDLEPLFGRIAPDDVYEERGALAAYFGESMMDSRPLQGLIAAYVDGALIEAVAAGHEEGRRLYVGTTNFDVGHFVIWDLGAIAAQRTEEAKQLFRRVLLASSAIPVFYPPVLFQVRAADGETGDEMHVDGSVVSPMFLPNQVLFGGDDVDEETLAALRRMRTVLTVVHNGSLAPSVEPVDRDTVTIAARSFLMVSASMVQEDVLHIYLMSRLWGADFRFACIPDEGEVSMLEFSAADAAHLFDVGLARGRDPSSWADSPPGYLVSDDLRGIQPVWTEANLPVRP